MCTYCFQTEKGEEKSAQKEKRDQTMEVRFMVLVMVMIQLVECSAVVVLSRAMAPRMTQVTLKMEEAEVVKAFQEKALLEGI